MIASGEGAGVVHTPVFDAVAPPRVADHPGFGYMSSQRGDLPLEEVWLHADIAGLAASVDLRATFCNDGADPVEATYVFPVPELGSVSSLQIRTGSTVIDGWLMERAEARNTYAVARVQRDAAAILEQEREDVVTIRVGTIAPNERVQVRLTLHARLTYTDGQAFFRFPLVVAPRYIPGARLPGEPVGQGAAEDTVLVPDASRVVPPVNPAGRVRLSASVTVAAGGYAIEEIGCTLRTHISSIASDPAVRIEALPGQRLDRDLALRIRTAAHRQPSLSLLTSLDGDGREGTFALTLLPPTVEPGPGAGRDVVIVVDASASMSGWRLPAARRAATRIIEILTPADQFSVLVFADRITWPDGAGAGLVEATERNRFRAMELLFTTAAAGDPVLLPALQAAAGLLSDPRRQSILVVITAGQVGNEDQIAAEFRLRAAAVRVHAIGVGATVNAGLLRQLANPGRGQVLLAESEDALDDLTPTLRRLLGPALLTNLGIIGEGIQLIHNTISPARPPEIYSGVSEVITGRFRGGAAWSIAVSGTGADGRPWANRVTAVQVGGRALTQLWAKAFLADLQRKYLRCRIEEAAGLEQLIVSTSLRFGVLSRLTAFVAVSNAPSRALGAPREVIQSVELPADWVEPEPGLSPYAIEYARMSASQRVSAAGQAEQQPASEPESLAVTGSGPIGYADALPDAMPHAMPDAQFPEALPPRAPAPPASPAPPQQSAPAPPQPSAPSPPIPSAAPPVPRGYSAPGAVPPHMPSPGDWQRSGRPPGGYPGQAPHLPTPGSPPHGGGRAPSRRGRYVGAGAAAVAAVALVVGVFGITSLAQQHSSTSSRSTTATPSNRSATAVDPRTGARLTATLTPQGTGSDVGAQVSGIPGGVAVRLVVVGRDGVRHQIDQWVMGISGSARHATTSLGPNEIASVAIEGAAGQAYVSAPIT